MAEIKVVPLGAGQDVGRSCIIVSLGGKNVMLDCGMHMGYNDDRRFPDFTYINRSGTLTEYLDCVIISHFHLDHCGALPYMSEMVGFDGPIYMTQPTKAICPILLEDYRKITVDRKGEQNFFTSEMIKNCMKKVVPVNLHQTVQVDDELEIKAYYAGHVLGAAMFRITVGSQSVVYTGDYNMTPDRHLGAAWIDKCRPDLLITESTYATTIRDSKRCRERDFLKKVHDCVDKGGKVPIVRGSPLMTHRITNANPNIRAFCLYSVNGQQVPIRPPCPTEPSAADGGEGFLEGTCDKGELVILLHSTKPLDVSLVQWAGAPSSQWHNSHNMQNCMSSTCSLANGNRTVTIRTGLSNGAFSFAVNVIYHYVLPNDWINHPEVKTCTSSGTSAKRRRRDTSNTLPSSTKFVLEVDEPRGRIKKQTRKFVLYFSTAMTPKVETNGDLTFSPHTGGKFTGIMQLAYSGVSPRGNLAVADFLDRYAGTYAYKPETKYCVKGDKGYISFDWNKQTVKGISGSGQLLMVVMPHHEQLLKGQGGFITGTPYGFKALAADSWLQELDLPDGSMEPDMTAVQKIKQNAQQHQDMMKALDSDVRQQPLTPVCKASNSYGAGKAIGAAVRLASISRAFGTTHYKSLDVQIEECLELWLRIKDGLANSNKLHYDTVWGGLMVRGVPDGQPINLGADFGFPTYNDHHFHLGYFMYALGYYTKYYPSWAKANRERILFLARDVGNPSYRDTHFPIVRHKDTFMGFSWATGVGPGTRQEESASEAINCYHGLAALGFGTKMASVEQMGRLMLAQEIASVREYWQVRPHNLHHFPPTLQTYGVVGQIGEGSFYLYTLDWACDPNWFPMRHACLVGIQSIPITAVSKYWMDKDWAVSVSKVCGWALNPTSAPGSNLVDKSKLTPVVKGWAAFCHAATSHASASAQAAAANYVKSVPFNQLVPGTTTSGTLLFIYGST
ncbi:uncharacterized protein LOC106176683 [Lingula anatina]|uniref:glucan endo-1,3-beta-D-glucosidase n=1 Tax=Lingula anatina TaxID=7574 RepID=A0A1S3JW33_LINAN|nr:uncharacterized protein LOC106176683 [Lingula anatina]|eukprot:XP_013414620.1 uncharacterized protein LOC106176683 [Lingula anatina]